VFKKVMDLFFLLQWNKHLALEKIWHPKFVIATDTMRLASVNLNFCRVSVVKIDVSYFPWPGEL
jgi:hypothetical protein